MGKELKTSCLSWLKNLICNRCVLFGLLWVATLTALTFLGWIVGPVALDETGYTYTQGCALLGLGTFIAINTSFILGRNGNPIYRKLIAAIIAVVVFICTYAIIVSFGNGLTQFSTIIVLLLIFAQTVPFLAGEDWRQVGEKDFPILALVLLLVLGWWIVFFSKLPAAP